jgi:YHS domain-containing protein
MRWSDDCSGPWRRRPAKTVKGGEQVRLAALCIAVALLSLGVMGCQQAQETPAEQAETEVQETMPAEEEMALVDPVCGMAVTEDSEWSAEYEGETYYFCCVECRDKFMADPMTYLETEPEEETGT